MTIIEKIKDLTWFNLVEKIKSIFFNLDERVSTIEDTPQGASDLQAVLDAGTSVIYDNYQTMLTLLGSGQHGKYISLTLRSAPFGTPGEEDVYFSLDPTAVFLAQTIDTKKAQITLAGGNIILRENNNVLDVGTEVRYTNPIAETKLFFPAKTTGNYTIATIEDLDGALPTYATNAAAITGGLPINKRYKTATGEVRIVV